MSAAPPTAAPIIQLDGISQWYGDVIGVNQVSLDIQPGLTGLLGPNGAGKSTLLKIITGQLRPQSGTVRVLGEDPAESRELFRRVGYCPDSEATYEDFTAMEFCVLMGRLAGYGAAEARRRAADRLELMRLTADRDRRLRGYSKGMRQRAKLAAALLHDPKLIILDEPMNGLDPMGRLRLLELFRELGRQDISLLVSSHILHEIENLTDQVAIMHRGRLLAEGRVAEIRALIENQPLTLQFSSPRPRQLAARLVALASTVNLAFEGTRQLTVRTLRPEEVYNTVQQAMLAGEMAVEEMAAQDESLDAVFGYLTGTGAGTNGGLGAAPESVN